MAILRKSEIRKMKYEEKEHKLIELKAELSKQRALISAGGALENPTKARLLRRTIARLLTIMKEDEESP
ncbi:MAG: 50S ribosomal protein L29 [Candidatus Helarchaeota archaeon]|nr:50S ribosomal protein L29 [Candidatus Helarchaeota archaeon]